jgi:DNA polymerase-3 subunit delta
MKLPPRQVAAFCARPDTKTAAMLLHGPDPMRIALRRRELVRALIGADAEAEMRLVRLAPADLRDGPGRLGDEIRSLGFFAGPRAVILEGAADAQAGAVADALDDWQEGDARLVVTAGALTPRSRLRKLFEGHAHAAALAVYDDPPDRAEIEGLLSASGLAVSAEAGQALFALARMLEPGDFRQTLDKIALYKLGDAAPLEAGEVAALAPATPEAAVDEAVHAAADADVARIAPLVRRLEGQGTTPVAICIAATRHFRTLLAAAADPEGPAAALSRTRPAVFGPRRERMRSQIATWGPRRLETALRALVETDLALRSTSPVPAMALMERTLIRLAMIPHRG